MACSGYAYQVVSRAVPLQMLKELLILNTRVFRYK